MICSKYKSNNVSRETLYKKTYLQRNMVNILFYKNESIFIFVILYQRSNTNYKNIYKMKYLNYKCILQTKNASYIAKYCG